jgi:hypothetical protein
MSRNHNHRAPPESCIKALSSAYSYLTGAFMESLGNAIERRAIIEFNCVWLARTPLGMEGLYDFANHDIRINAHT